MCVGFCVVQAYQWFKQSGWHGHLSHNNCCTATFAPLCTLFCQGLIGLSTTSSLHFMWEKNANCVSCPKGSLLYWNRMHTVELWDDVSASDVCIMHWQIFSSSLSLLWVIIVPLSVLHRTTVMVRCANMNSCYLTRTILTLLRWLSKLALEVTNLGYISSMFIPLNVSGCHWFYIWKHGMSSSLDKSGCNQLKLL